MKTFLIALFSLATAASFAAGPAFVVYYSKGSISKAGMKTLLKKGDQLSVNDKLQMGEGSKLVLVCSNYQVIQLVKKGTYAVKDLVTKCTSNTSYSSAYFKYVWNEFSHPHGKPEKDPESYMKNVGAVSRGCNEVVFGVPMDTIQYYAGALPLQWWAAYSKPSAAIFDQALDGAAINKLPLTAGQALQINKLVQGLQPGVYYWQLVGQDGGNCERKYLQLWSKNEYAAKLKSLLKSVPVTTPAETAFATGFVMHENNFMAEALRYYKRAASLNPENIVYKNAVNKFYETKF